MPLTFSAQFIYFQCQKRQWNSMSVCEILFILQFCNIQLKESIGILLYYPFGTRHLLTYQYSVFRTKNVLLFCKRKINNKVVTLLVVSGLCRYFWWTFARVETFCIFFGMSLKCSEKYLIFLEFFEYGSRHSNEIDWFGSERIGKTSKKSALNAIYWIRFYITKYTNQLDEMVFLHLSNDKHLFIQNFEL